MKSYRLELIVFLCGAIVMIYELVGSRVLAPHLGTSTFVWTSLIGVILGSLSIGYWAGGRLADRKPEREALGGVIFIAALFVGTMTNLDLFVINIVGLITNDIRLRSLFTSIFLFSPASILLGMVTPYAVKLKSVTLRGIGSTVGDLYAFSTVGSIFGTFLAGFYLIPILGTKNILIMISFALTLVAIITLPKRLYLQKLIMVFYCLVIYFGGYYLTKRYNPSLVLLDTDTQYSRVQIYESIFDNKSPVRLMRLSDVINSGVFLNKDDLLLPYTRSLKNSQIPSL